MSQTYVMQVVHNDVSGERGEAYMLVPLAARDHDPGFWGWPSSFSTSGQYRDRVVRAIDDGTARTTRIYFVDERREFRLATELYSVGPTAAGSILEVVRAPRPGIDFEYRIHLPGSTRHSLLSPHLQHAVANSTKTWGYL